MTVHFTSGLLWSKWRTLHRGQDHDTWACLGPVVTVARQYTHSINYSSLLSTRVSCADRWYLQCSWCSHAGYYSPISPSSFKSNSAYLSAKQTKRFLLTVETRPYPAHPTSSSKNSIQQVSDMSAKHISLKLCWQHESQRNSQKQLTMKSFSCMI